jgi:hypothetical protein
MLLVMPVAILSISDSDFPWLEIMMILIM